MKSGAHYQWDLVCDGPHRSAASASLIDTDMLDPREAWRRNTKSDWLVRGAVLVLAGALLLVGALNIDWQDKAPDYGWPNWLAGAGLLLAVFGFPFLTVFRLSRESRVAQHLLTKEMNSYLQGSDGFD